MLGIADARIERSLPGGNSNVTELVSHAGGKLIVRRAPLNTISDSAGRGIVREFHMLTALQGRVPVPETLGFCSDAAILGSPFIVMQYVDGVSITTKLPEHYENSAVTLDRIGEELIDALAAIHNIEWEALPLKRTAPPSDYLKVQIKRWMKTRAAAPIRDLPLIEEVGHALLQRLPPEPRSTIIHGDYHLDNTMFRRDQPRLAAVIDWELASIGDPLADLGLTLACWGPRAVDPPGFAFVQQVTRGCPLDSRASLARRWSAATGISVEHLPLHCAYALWRLAAIVEGAYALCVGGQVDSDYARSLASEVPRLLDEADALIKTA